jgi:arginase family enzyme
MACGFRRFRQFEAELERRLREQDCREPTVTFVGSGDFHHVSLAQVRRIRRPFNLLVLDNHPDWMRGIPLLHCGTWLYHAARLPNVRTIFHVGGDVDFDNGYRLLAPWSMLRSGKVQVIPAVRRYQKGNWKRIGHEPLHARRLSELLAPLRGLLGRRPLYVSLDKDVMGTTDAVVNWDSGHLDLAEVEAVIRAFLDAAGGRLAGMDVAGDWSPVGVNGILRRVLHWTEHPTLAVEPRQATRRNEETNLRLLAALRPFLARAGLSISA